MRLSPVSRTRAKDTASSFQNKINIWKKMGRREKASWGREGERDEQGQQLEWISKALVLGLRQAGRMKGSS